MTTPTTEPATDMPAWIGLLALAGMIAAVAGHLTGTDPVAGLGAAALLLAAGAGMSRGWWAGTGPKPSRAQVQEPVRGLVGSRIVCGAGEFVILDDSAVTGSGRRATVVAADARGQVGLLFLGFDAAGAVTEAATGDGAWSRATVRDWGT